MSDLLQRMRALESDHGPDGWPAVQMRDISELRRQIRALCIDLEDERRQHEITRGELERTRLVRDELHNERDDLISALHRLWEQCERLRLPGQNQTAAELNADALLRVCDNARGLGLDCW